MSAQEKFKVDVVAAVRDLVAVAGLSHLPLLRAVAALVDIHRQQNIRDFEALDAAREKMLDAAVVAERKACAKIASDRAAICQASYDAGDKTEVHPLNEALHIAQLIRNRER